MNGDTSWPPQLLWLIWAIAWISKVIFDVNFCTKMYFKPSLQVILNDVRYHKYIIIIIIIGKFHSRKWPWLQDDGASSSLCLSQIRMEANNPWCEIFLQRFRSRLFNTVVLVFFIRPQVFPLPTAKLSGDHPLATWWSKYHWFKLVKSPEKHWLSIVFVGQIAVPF